MAKIYQIAFELAGKLKDSFGASIGGANQKLAQLHNQIVDIQKNQKAVESFNKIESSVQKNVLAYNQAIKRLYMLQQEFSNTESPTVRMSYNLDRAKEKVSQLSDKIYFQREQLSQLKSKLQSAGVATDNLAAENERLTQSFNKAKTAQEKFQAIQSKQQALKSQRSDMYGKMIDTAAMTGALAMPLKAYADLNQAQTDLEMAIMTDKGVPPQLKELKDIAVDLGNKLPGTTADFFQLARALAENGMKLDTIVAKGGAAFKSAAYLAVVMHQAPDAAGEFVAKMREAYQLTEDELPKMADYTQRIKAAFGVNMEDFKVASEYIAAPLGALNVKGAEATQTIATLMGLFAQNGLSGQKAGTGMRELLMGMLKYKDLMHKNSKEAEHFRSILGEYGIQMEFFKDGKFAGLENMLVQLEKLKKIGDDEKRLEVMKKIFGDEGLPAASIASKIGKSGLNDGQTRLDEVASLDDKIKKAVGTYKNTLEALQGTMVNLWAAIGEPIASLAIPKIQSMNETLGKLQNVYEAHPALQKTVGILGSLFTGLVAVKVATLAMSYAWSLASGGALALQSAMFLISNSTIGIRVGLMALAAWQGVVTAAQWAWNAAMTANPIGLIIVGIGALVAAGVALYTHWDTVKAKFFETWDGIKNWFSTLSLYESGKKLIMTFVNGLIDSATEPTKALIDILAKMRQYLPFSDAKEGPLSQLTLSGRKVVETFGEGISSANDLGGVFASKVGGIGNISAGFSGGGFSGGGGAVIHFAPVININGGGDVRGDLMTGLRAGADDLQIRIDQMNRNRRRLSYE